MGFSSKRQGTNFYLLLILPVVLLEGALSLYPVIYTIYISFTNESLRQIGAQFIGFSNYLRALKDPFFLNALKLTFIYMIGAIALRLGGGLGFALLLNSKLRGSSIPRVAIMLPWILSEIVAAAMWLWILDHQTGVLNAVLKGVGLASVPWLAQPRIALASVVFVSLWKNLAFSFILLFAALQNVPLELYEASKIDGASSFDCLRYITLPLIGPTILILIIMITISTFNQFSLVYALTGGGPLRATELTGLYMYEQSFVFGNLGYGAALAVFILLGNLLLSMLYYRALRSEGA